MHSCAFGHMLLYKILGLRVYDLTAKRLTGLMRYLLCNSFVIWGFYCVFCQRRDIRFMVTRWGSARPRQDLWRRRRTTQGWGSEPRVQESQSLCWFQQGKLKLPRQQTQQIPEPLQTSEQKGFLTEHLERLYLQVGCDAYNPALKKGIRIFINAFKPRTSTHTHAHTHLSKLCHWPPLRPWCWHFHWLRCWATCPAAFLLKEQRCLLT